MDAGLAAVIAGAAGAGGAALAAFATSLGLLRQAKMQGNQAHQQWLRDRQQQAYEELLVAADGVEHACRDWMDALRSGAGSDHPDPFLATLRAQSRNLRAATHRTVLIADTTTGGGARGLQKAVITVSEKSLDVAHAHALNEPLPAPEELDRARDAARTARTAFIDQARTALRQK
ncbi:hypothetical protein ACIOG7_10500 [Streptomyces sp. NPDC087894]|uniref:hypothetical protein n=1 Tax=Streptomyces sp. NPDC087894 TaxID=3365816 RepID=UPI00380B3EC7